MMRSINAGTLFVVLAFSANAQKKEMVKFVKEKTGTTIHVNIGSGRFTSFIYPDTLAKPVLYPILAASGTVVTRGYPINPIADEPTDHPHHLGLWLNFENVNGLDFWNNSFAIPAAKKHLYGSIRTDKVIKTKDGEKGILSYHANWVNQKNEVLLEETTQYTFSGSGGQRIIDRITVLKANTEVTFTDAKDGLLGLRVAHELQIPSREDKKYTDDKGNVTVVKGELDKIATGNYLTSEGKTGDAAWSTRAAWCKLYGKMKNDSVSIAIIDHPRNINYPTFWHARGYGLFAANPLGEKIFTNGQSAKNLQLKKGETVRFAFRVVVDEGAATLTPAQLNRLADEFAKTDPGSVAAQ
ncbi:MAG: PmoA family protein [Candidatus Pseudobacter hemicellulosilyticus]|uniref:PmoA family protein n=1 Tax=Candidatus Pseudobacter hemicellulosilyticus TaxID=3121375 RepID=A0AAJ5WXD9_9BACT|nr:MAG: PmoA family protein [Pseudobacter sp.]